MSSGRSQKTNDNKGRSGASRPFRKTREPDYGSKSFDKECADQSGKGAARVPPESAVEALAIVELSPRKAAGLLGDTLRSAVANAENNLDVNRKELTVKAALVSPGPIIKRFRAKPRVSAGRIRKRTSHLEIILTDN